jgi:DNA-binding Lrp family transcriptional regulator
MPLIKSNLSVGNSATPEQPGADRFFMDQLTKKIIAILRRDGRASYSDIARELDTTRDYVASRVNPLFQSGELRVIAAPHPRVLGLTVSAHLSLKISGDAHAIVKALEHLESLVFISVAAGAYQIIVETELHSMTELGQQVSMIRALDGVLEVQVLLYERVLRSFFLGAAPPESFSFNFDKFDINIIKRLQQDGRASYADLAQNVGLSLSGCRIRVQRLLELGVMQIGAIQQRSDMTDDLLFGIGINAHADLHDVTQLLGAAPGLEFMARTVGRYDLIATLSFNSLRDFNQLISRLLALASVSYCEQWLHVQLVRERYEHTLEHLTASASEVD